MKIDQKDNSAEECLNLIDERIVYWRNLLKKRNEPEKKIGDQPAMFFPEAISYLVYRCLTISDEEKKKVLRILNLWR